MRKESEPDTISLMLQDLAGPGRRQSNTQPVGIQESNISESNTPDADPISLMLQDLSRSRTRKSAIPEPEPEPEPERNKHLQGLVLKLADGGQVTLDRLDHDTLTMMAKGLDRETLKSLSPDQINALRNLKYKHQKGLMHGIARGVTDMAKNAGRLARVTAKNAAANIEDKIITGDTSTKMNDVNLDNLDYADLDNSLSIGKGAAQMTGAYLRDVSEFFNTYSLSGAMASVASGDPFWAKARGEEQGRVQEIMGKFESGALSAEDARKEFEDEFGLFAQRGSWGKSSALSQLVMADAEEKGIAEAVISTQIFADPTNILLPLAGPLKGAHVVNAVLRPVTGRFAKSAGAIALNRATNIGASKVAKEAAEKNYSAALEEAIKTSKKAAEAFSKKTPGGKLTKVLQTKAKLFSTFGSLTAGLISWKLTGGLPYIPRWLIGQVAKKYGKSGGKAVSDTIDTSFKKGDINSLVNALAPTVTEFSTPALKAAARNLQNADLAAMSAHSQAKLAGNASKIAEAAYKYSNKAEGLFFGDIAATSLNAAIINGGIELIGSHGDASQARDAAVMGAVIGGVLQTGVSGTMPIIKGMMSEKPAMRVLTAEQQAVIPKAQQPILSRVMGITGDNVDFKFYNTTAEYNAAISNSPKSASNTPGDINNSTSDASSVIPIEAPVTTEVQTTSPTGDIIPTKPTVNRKVKDQIHINLESPDAIKSSLASAWKTVYSNLDAGSKHKLQKSVVENIPDSELQKIAKDIDEKNGTNFKDYAGMDKLYAQLETMRNPDGTIKPEGQALYEELVRKSNILNGLVDEVVATRVREMDITKPNTTSALDSVIMEILNGPKKALPKPDKVNSPDAELKIPELPPNYNDFINYSDLPLLKTLEDMGFKDLAKNIFDVFVGVENQKTFPYTVSNGYAYVGGIKIPEKYAKRITTQDNKIVEPELWGKLADQLDQETATRIIEDSFKHQTDQIKMETFEHIADALDRKELVGDLSEQTSFLRRWGFESVARAMTDEFAAQRAYFRDYAKKLGKPSEEALTDAEFNAADDIYQVMRSEVDPLVIEAFKPLVGEDAAPGVAEAIRTFGLNQNDFNAIHNHLAAIGDINKIDQKKITLTIKELHKKLSKELRHRNTNTERIQAGITTFQTAESFSKGVFQEARKQLTTAVKNLEGVETSRITESEGLYGNVIEPTFDLEVIVPRGSDIQPLADTLIQIAKKENQYDTFLSKVVDKTHPNARPMVEVGFKKPATPEQLKAVMDEFTSRGIDGFTVVKDEKGNTLGIRTQFIPEIAARWDSDARAKLAEGKYPDLADIWSANMQDAVPILKKMDYISYAGDGYMSTDVWGKENYAKPHKVDLDGNAQEHFDRRIASLED
jgi:RNA binding exosome subunit